MKLFSTRNPLYNQRLPIRSLRSEKGEDQLPRQYPTYRFIQNETQVRIWEELSYFIESSYLEKFLLINNKEKDKIYINKDAISKLTKRELGYDISQLFDSENLSLTQLRENSMVYMDFIELFCIFTTEEKRKNVIERINSILEENNEKFKLFNGMLLRRNGEITSISELYKEPILAEKFRSLNEEVLSNKAKSKISADILQYIFSTDSKDKDTKEYSEELLKTISMELTTEDSAKTLTENLNSLIILAKKLNNGITDIRHTDKNTIPISSPDIYALIHGVNIGIIDLIIKTQPNKYLTFWEPEELKKQYLVKYSIRNIIKIIEPTEYDNDELPF